MLHIPDLGSQERGSLAVKSYFFFLGLTFLVISGIRLRSILNLNRSAYTVVRTVQLTALDTMLSLAPEEKKTLSPQRGQYVYLKLGFISEDHPFSVTHYDPASGQLSVAFRRAGMYTQELLKLREGQTVYLSGPYGSFTEDLTADDDRPVVYIAGGIGVTPFVDRILNESSTREQWLFAANRNRDLAVLYQPLKEKLGDHAVGVFNQQDGDLLPHEELGFVSAELLRKYLGEPARYTFYLCGPPPMMQALTDTIRSLGVDERHILSEKFGW